MLQNLVRAAAWQSGCPTLRKPDGKAVAKDDTAMLRPVYVLCPPQSCMLDYEAKCLGGAARPVQGEGRSQGLLGVLQVLSRLYTKLRSKGKCLDAKSQQGVSHQEMSELKTSTQLPPFGFTKSLRERPRKKGSWITPWRNPTTQAAEN